jgi:HD-GYP domain-containing protein (c-di-GMP phosphodiesterase class II)
MEYSFSNGLRGKEKDVREFLSSQELLAAGVLHDIGKIRIPQEILYKPGKLTEEEFKVMKMHPIFSAMMLYPVYPLRHLCPVVRGHHEKWDGKGYPDGLSGESIPVAARIIAIADVFDALISDRPYKKGMKWEKAKKIMVEGRGTHFDPDLLDLFLEQMTPIYER